MVQLFDLFKFSKLVKMEDGEFTLMDTPVNVIPTSVLCEQQKGLIEAIGLEAAYKTIYESVKQGSKNYNEAFIKKQGFTDKRKMLDWQAKIISFAGWGKLEIAYVDYEQGKLVAHFKNSAFPRLYKELHGKSTYPVDIIPCGFNAGGLSVIAKKELDVFETKCLAMGDPFCEFEAGPPDVIKQKRDELWKKLGLI